MDKDGEMDKDGDQSSAMLYGLVILALLAMTVLGVAIWFGSKV